MAVFDTIKNRRSIRSYTDKPVEEEKLLKALEAARLSPSAVNFQPWSFVVVKEQNIKTQLAQSYPVAWFNKAPVIIVACVNPQTAWRRRDGEEFWKVDAAIAMQSMILVASELGLGTCWICAFDEEKAKEVLGIPENIRAVAMTPLGYSAEQKGAVSDRKSLAEVVHYDKW